MANEAMDAIKLDELGYVVINGLLTDHLRNQLDAGYLHRRAAAESWAYGRDYLD